MVLDQTKGVGDDGRLLMGSSVQGNMNLSFLDNLDLHHHASAARSSEDHRHDFVDDNKPANYNYDPAQRTIYWESQEFLLQEILDQYNSSGTKLREQIKRHIEDMIATYSNFCNCLDQNLKLGFCMKCLRQAAVHRLCTKGYTAVLCKSKWKKTHKMPGGKHEYIEVMGSTQGRRKQIPFLVEIGFPDEFKMAKACDEFNRLTDQLPEIFIGKAEHLNAIIRLMCDAAKRSSDEQKIHMGPWRRRSFMLMKWAASNAERKVLDQSSNEHLISTSSGFQLPMPTTVRVA